MRYVIISEIDINVMINAINSMINKGWKPIGGIAYNKDDGYLQAMIRNS